MGLVFIAGNQKLIQESSILFVGFFRNEEEQGLEQTLYCQHRENNIHNIHTLNPAGLCSYVWSYIHNSTQ